MRLFHCQLFAAILLTACAGQPPADIGPGAQTDGNRVLSLCSSDPPRWSPDSSRVPYATIGTFPQCWYSQFLQALEEPALRNLTGTDTSIRVLVLPTWAPASLMRIQREGPTFRLIVARTVGPGGYDPQGLAWRRDTTFTLAQWREVTLPILAARFWVVPSDPPQGMDGTQWVIEVREGSKYSALEIWSLDDDGPWAYQRQALHQLLALARLPLTQ